MVYADTARDDVQGFYNLGWALLEAYHPSMFSEVELCDFEVKFMAQAKAVSTTQSLPQHKYILLGWGDFPEFLYETLMFKTIMVRYTTVRDVNLLYKLFGGVTGKVKTVIIVSIG